MMKLITHSGLTIVVMLVFFVACNTNSKVEQEKEVGETTSIDIAEMQLKFEKEKIYLLSVSRKMSYDTVYQILRDYYSSDYNNLISGDFGLTDESIKRYEENITALARKYQLTKHKVASLIFSFKYEMRTEDEIIEDYQSANYDQFEYDQ